MIDQWLPKQAHPSYTIIDRAVETGSALLGRGSVTVRELGTATADTILTFIPFEPEQSAADTQAGPVAISFNSTNYMCDFGCGATPPLL